MDERTIFLEAVDKSDLAERESFLTEACGNDSEMRQRIDGLLRAHNDAGSFLEKTPEEIDAMPGPTAISDDAHSQNCDTWMELLTSSDEADRLGTLAGYDVIELIGRGGMGVVLRAHDPKLNRIVAIKLLAPELAANVMAVRRFLREAQAAAAVSHDHVVTIHAIDEHAQPPVIVMEYIGGQSLQQKIDRVGALDVKSVLRIGMQTAAGLAAAHRQGLVHRDIKPANILLENGIERVKLTDFGLARAVDDIGMTRTGQITGTPQYMSPEQAQGQRVDHRTDLFSLGCVLYAMCTGQAAFRADSAVAVMHSIVHDRPRPIRELNEDIPDWLCAIVDKLLSKNPKDRLESAEAVEDLLGRHLRHLQQPDSNPQPNRVATFVTLETWPARNPLRAFAEFWMTPQPNFARKVSYPCLALLLTFSLVLTAALSFGAGESEATIVAILASGIFGMPVAFVVLVILWARSQRRQSTNTNESDPNRSFWGILFALVPIAAGGFARVQLGLSGMEAGIVAAILGGLGAGWLYTSRRRMTPAMAASTVPGPPVAASLEPPLDRFVDLSSELTRELRGVGWTLTLVALASFVTPVLLYTAADQSLLLFAETAFWISLVMTLVVFPVVIRSALDLNWLELTRRRPGRVLLLATCLAVIPTSPLVLILLPWTVRAYRRVRRPDVLAVLGVSTDSSRVTGLTPFGRRRARAAVMWMIVLLLVALTTAEAAGWTHWTLRSAGYLSGAGTVMLNDVSPDCTVHQPGNASVTVGEAGTHRMSLARGGYDFVALRKSGRFTRLKQTVEAGSFTTLPFNEDTTWVFVRRHDREQHKDGMIIVETKADLICSEGQIYRPTESIAVIFAPSGNYQTNIRTSHGRRVGTLSSELKPGGTLRVMPTSSAVLVSIERVADTETDPPAESTGDSPFFEAFTKFATDPGQRSDVWKLVVPIASGKPSMKRGTLDDGTPFAEWRLDSRIEGASKSLRDTLTEFQDYITVIAGESGAKVNKVTPQQGPNREFTNVDIEYSTDSTRGTIRLTLTGFKDQSLHGEQFLSCGLRFEIQESR